MTKRAPIAGMTEATVVTVPLSNVQETFCNNCGQLRLWLKPEAPSHCGHCVSPDIITGPFGGKELPLLRAQWRALRGQ